MAMLMPVAPGTRIDAAYWRLTHLRMDCVAQVIEAQLHGYRDEAARRAGCAPLQSRRVTFAAGTLEEPGVITLAAIYRAIRAHAPVPGAAPLFHDAQDA